MISKEKFLLAFANFSTIPTQNFVQTVKSLTITVLAARIVAIMMIVVVDTLIRKCPFFVLQDRRLINNF
jgi:hypothetical protein